MTLAERTQTAVTEYPFLGVELQSEIIDSAAAARFLDVGETGRSPAYAPSLDPVDGEDRDQSARMYSGIEPTSGVTLAVVMARSDGPEAVRTLKTVGNGSGGSPDD
ncbi:MAG: DUF7523 family protein [Halococcoides sp.]